MSNQGSITNHTPSPSVRKSLSEWIFGPAPDANLPERIREAVAEQQRQSEILVGWIQLTLVLTMGTLYLLAPKTIAADAIPVVPVALALYLVFTVVRLVASYRINLPHWVLMMSTVVDIALLMVLIWSFHIQYDQPASFYLKAPTMLRRAAHDQAAAADLSRFVSREVADRITHADQSIKPGDGESKIATVMFTDIEGFSTVSEKLTSAELVRTLNDYFGAIYEAIAPYGGVIAQYQGDAMLITFNTVTPNEDHARNAIETAFVIQDVMESTPCGDGIYLKTRCGINTGEMTVGAVGAEERLIFTVHGDEVNIAARLEPINKEYGTYIMLSASTREEAGEIYDYERKGEVVVRGRSQPTDIFTVRRKPSVG